MANKKISELDQTLNLSDQADFPLSQDNGGEPTTFRAKLTQIATKIAEAITFSNLKTGNKQLVSAVNQTISNLADDFNTTAGSTYAKDDCVLYNGVLYQCINNSGTTSGIFIDADWTAIKAVDVGSGGGGGGGAGGHTIVDDDGTSLTQRTNLQFKGAYSEDNSTDDTTEVNVIREMTKAEFDLLSAAEKKGLINITDITGGNDDRFQPVIYSTEEREIGVWKDGKPLYQKTVIITNADKNSSYDLGITDFDTYFVCDGSIDTTGIIPYLHGTYPDNSIGGFLDNTGSSLAWAFRSESQAPATVNGFITVRYTKTTDQAGSGQWTPQGVPAVHYSEDEKVVGTWVDGSTLYEKTIYNAGGTYGNIDIQHGVSNLDKVIYAEGVCADSGSTPYNYYPFSRISNDGNNIGISVATTGQVSVYIPSAFQQRIVDIYVTIRYTKSST